MCCVCAKSLQLCLTLCDPMDCSLPGSRLFCPSDSPGRNTGMGYYALRQGIFPTQGLNPGLMSPAFAAAAAKSFQSCPTMCDPIGQPTRLPRPWDSPGKNTGVGCHFLLQCMKVKIESEVAQSCPTLSDPMDCSPLGSSIHGIFQARVLEWGAIAFSACIGRWVPYHRCHLGGPEVI